MATSQNAALVEYERASNAATELAERIARCGRAGVGHVEMVELLRAWQQARDAARASHERFLSSSRRTH